MIHTERQQRAGTRGWAAEKCHWPDLAFDDDAARFFHYVRMIWPDLKGHQLLRQCNLLLEDTLELVTEHWPVITAIADDKIATTIRKTLESGNGFFSSLLDLYA